MRVRRAEARWIEKEARWRIEVRKDGARRVFYSKNATIKGKREAERAADAWLATGESGDMRFGELWGKYLERCRETTGTANYQKHEQIGRVWLLPSLKVYRMTEITPLMWQRCIDEAYKKGRAKKTCSNIKASIKAAHSFAKMLRIPVAMPELMVPRGAPTKKKHILQPEKLRLLFETGTVLSRKRPRKVFYIHAWRFLVLTGLRRGEVCGLRVEDIKGDVLTVRRSINEQNEETTGKNENARRTFNLPQLALDVLAQQAEMLKECGIVSPWIFPNKSGGRTVPNHMYKEWRRYREEHGIECNLHELRHTMISITASSVPESLLKEMVGHSAKMDTLGVYGHQVDGDAQRAAKLVQGAFGRMLENND